MDAMDKNTLQVFSLGRFEVKRGGQAISREDQRLNKRWRLFQVLITYKGQALSSEQMYKYLSLEESVNPSEALKSLVFYLRRSLGKDKTKVKNGEQYINCSQGRYLFNEKSHYWLDAEVFETLCKKGRQVAEESTEIAIDIYLEALSLYRGNYLGDVPHAYWAIPARNHYRELYLRAMLEANELLRKEARYQEAWELCEKGLRIVPLEEKLHTSSLKALIDGGKAGLALIQYQEAASLYKENGLDVPATLKGLGESLKKESKKPENPEEILQKLQARSREEGAFESSLENFSLIYELEKSRSERRQNPGYLVYLNLNGECADSEVEQIGKSLKNSLKKNLRKGDVFCNWGLRNFMAILTNVPPGEIGKIMERIKKNVTPEFVDTEMEFEHRWNEI